MYIETVCKRLKEARKEKGLTQEEVANKIEVTQKTLSKYERGIIKPPLEIIGRLADLYDRSLDWIFGRDEKVQIS